VHSFNSHSVDQMKLCHHHILSYDPFQPKIDSVRTLIRLHHGVARKRGSNA